MADPDRRDPASSTDTALRTVVHGDLLPALVAARRGLDDADPATAGRHLAHAHEVAVGLLRPAVPADDRPGDPAATLVAAVATVRDRHPGLEVAAADPHLPDRPAAPALCDLVHALVVEAGTNAARHRRSGRLVITATGDDERLDVVARSTGVLHHGTATDAAATTDPTDAADASVPGPGTGLALLRARVGELGGTLQVLHDPDATILVASLPWPPAAAESRPVTRDHHDV